MDAKQELGAELASALAHGRRQLAIGIESVVHVAAEFRKQREHFGAGRGDFGRGDVQPLGALTLLNLDRHPVQLRHFADRHLVDVSRLAARRATQDPISGALLLGRELVVPALIREHPLERLTRRVEVGVVRPLLRARPTDRRLHILRHVDEARLHDAPDDGEMLEAQQIIGLRVFQRRLDVAPTDEVGTGPRHYQPRSVRAASMR